MFTSAIDAFNYIIYAPHFSSFLTGCHCALMIVYRIFFCADHIPGWFSAAHSWFFVPVSATYKTDSGGFRRPKIF